MQGLGEQKVVILDNFAPRVLAERLTFMGTGILHLLVYFSLTKLRSRSYLPLFLSSEWEIFIQMKPTELLGTAWQSEDKKTRAPNVVALIDHYNRVTSWVAMEIVVCVHLLCVSLYPSVSNAATSGMSNSLRLKRVSAVIGAIDACVLSPSLSLSLNASALTRVS